MIKQSLGRLPGGLVWTALWRPACTTVCAVDGSTRHHGSAVDFGGVHDSTATVHRKERGLTGEEVAKLSSGRQCSASSSVGDEWRHRLAALRWRRRLQAPAGDLASSSGAAEPTRGAERWWPTLGKTDAAVWRSPARLQIGGPPDSEERWRLGPALNSTRRGDFRQPRRQRRMAKALLDGAGLSRGGRRFGQPLSAVQVLYLAQWWHEGLPQAANGGAARGSLETDRRAPCGRFSRFKNKTWKPFSAQDN
jgi:hypothetical protein